MDNVLDAALDAATKFADGCSKLNERMDAIEKRRADVSAGFDHLAASGQHTAKAMFHHAQAMKSGKGVGGSYEHQDAHGLHLAAANHHFNAHISAGNEKKRRAAIAHEASAKANAFSEKL